MASKCLDSTLFPNSGTSQVQRLLEALSAGYAKVDERTTADMILFAKKYGACLNFYDETNTVSGDWAKMMSGDISVTIAAVTAWRGADYIPYIRNLYDSINTPAAPYTDPVKTFKYVFDFVFSIARGLNQVLPSLSADTDYSNFLNTAIASRLSIPLYQLSTLYLSFLGGIIPAAPVAPDPNAPFDDIIAIPADAMAFAAQFSFLTLPPWAAPAGTPIPPPGLFAGNTVNQVVANNLFTGAVNAFLNGIVNLITQTAGYLEETLANYPTHAPHYALYLSFLRLFRLAQDHLNGYTGRHLDFYYKKVLRLVNNPGMPDTAHLVFTLQKNSPQHLLQKDTAFKAGKDANNNDLFYALTDDIVVNQASVQFLRSILLQKNKTGVAQQLYASPTANSADGQGGKLTSPDKSWYPFGDLTNPELTIATTGFAIASNILYLNEGPRTVTLTFQCKSLGSFTASGLGDVFTAQLTGDKKWFDANGFPAGNNVLVDTLSGNRLSITITLNGDAPPIVPYSQKIHGGNFTQALPMVQLQLANYQYYSVIKGIIVQSITVDVEADNVQNLVLQNDNGKIDTSKPFKPFGEFPDTDASFLIGSKEVFQKQLTSLTINTDWPATTSTGAPLSGTTVDITALQQGQWKLPSSAIDVTGATIVIPSPGSFPLSAADFTVNEEYKISSVNGFIRLRLLDSRYDLSTYLTNVQNNLQAPSVTVHYNSDGSVGSYSSNAPTVTQSPPLLVSNPISLQYAATTTIGLSENTAAAFALRSNFYYHIEPFGFRELHPWLLSTLDHSDTLLPDNTLTFLPVFHLDNGLTNTLDNGGTASPDNGGELWIGLSNTLPGEVQSILFQVAEGSANPLKDIAKVDWYYLSGNNWVALGDPVNDQTNDLSQSGLVILNLPGNETTDNTRADTGLLWIKGVAAGNTDAVCRLIDVLANAAMVQFVTNTAGKIEFTKNIDAATISKAAIPDAALKKINQPYPSFGGRPQESDTQFDQRVSERLRHKHRAVTAWDYERLVLQNFPQIHKVKCLNHTALNETTQEYSEIRPGHVMIVTVPDLSLVTGANPLLPFTNVGLLKDIQDYLQPLTSPFVCLQVKNPQFEAVQFDFQVSFINNNSNSAFYKTQLDADLEEFLMPWAFGSQAADIEFGGRIEKSVVLNFVQSRPYVDFVTCFQMNQYVYQEDGTFQLLATNIETAVASTARSILVPYHDPLTNVDNIITTPANCNCNGQ